MCQEFIKAGGNDKFDRLVQGLRSFEEQIQEPGAIEKLSTEEILRKCGEAAFILSTEYDVNTPVGKNIIDGLSLSELDLSTIEVEDISDIKGPIAGYRAA